MSRPIAIAADRALFEIIRQYLVSADYPGIDQDSIENEPLTDAVAAREWLDQPGRTLLVIVADLPSAPGAARDRFDPGSAVRQLQQDVDDAGIATPWLVITAEQGTSPAIEAACTWERRAIALPMRKLTLLKQAILRPFLAMLLGQQDATGAIPGTFRVIEVDFGPTTSRCYLGFGAGSLLLWRDSQPVRHLRKTALLFDENFYKGHRWPAMARNNGEVLFTSHVVDAIGEGLFGHIERAAGGLKGLAFRYVISDESLYLAPFEASVRPMGEQDGPFVLLHAPLARRLPPRGSIRAAKTFNTRMPTPARVLFVRSQMGEHPDGPTTGDNYTLLLPASDGSWKQKPALFARLENVDVELEALQTLACTQPDRLVLDVADLSNPKECPPGEAAAYLEQKLKAGPHDVIHYAGHAWSDLDGPAHLILPGAAQGEASGLSLSTFAGFDGLTDTRLIYLSACRGISKGTVQNLVAYGIPHGIGFRYQVEDDRAALFAATFYQELFDTGFVSVAFRAACAEARKRLRTDDESSIWLSPILLAQAADWAMRA